MSGGYGRGDIAVVFDLEDSRPLDDNLENLSVFADLGVRTPLPTYNHANGAGAGCLDTDDTGITAWGRAIVTGLNEVGIVPVGSHCSARTRRDMCETSAELVGVDQLGISSDFSFDYADFVAELTRNPQIFDDSYTRWGPIQWMPREILLTLGAHLSWRGLDGDRHPRRPGRQLPPRG